MTLEAGAKAMQGKKNQESSITYKPANSAEAKNASNVKAIVNFVGDIKSEFKQIDWTNREDLLNYTKIIVMSCVVMGIGIFITDLLIQGVLASLGEVVRLIVG